MDNSQEGMKHQPRAATQAQQGMTFHSTKWKIWTNQNITSIGMHKFVLSAHQFQKEYVKKENIKIKIEIAIFVKHSLHM